MNNDNNKVVYLHYKKGTNEVFYVGIGNKDRPSQKGSLRSKWWNRVVDKYGYDIQVITKDISYSQAKAIEIALISTYGRMDLGLGTLVNMTNGGDGVSGHIHTKEVRYSQSKRMIGNKNMLGKKHSQDSKDKMSSSLKGREVWNKGKKMPVGFSDKMRDLSTGRKASIETRNKMSKSKMGYRHSEESIERMRSVQSNRSELTKKRMSDSQKGKVISKEANLKHIRTKRRKVISDEAYKVLIEELNKKVSGDVKHTRAHFANKFNVCDSFIKTQLKKIRNNNIII